MSLSPYNEFILVMPSGAAKGFNDLDLAKACINLYYENKIKEYSKEEEYNDSQEMVGETRLNICQHLGVEEGECIVYYLEDFLERLREELVFDEEKEEVISKLLKEKIDFNIYNLGLDVILHDVKTVDMIEPFGEM
ncbi:hypothetical protein KPL39_01165 [Clostridium gasigenes]|uniref:Uncharacterized protein n=1 Tax=Clostridium gasigenes TaxID=94869 RepID=A0A7X0VS58_9CLOT|nr:hypothetical protein [Clostridium gasigenes]MBB6716102.1 hypothetical protein [Clostridium gasigenes]MBU3134870.1 hypothetical protein [Clostridium gasigenes]